MELSTGAVKEKRRNSEKRKEKSRDAARCRRSKESEIFSNLSQVLPLPANITSHLDKASIMRLVIAHLRIRDLFKSVSTEDEKKEDDAFDSYYLKALGGVILVLSPEGEIIYVSNNVPIFLGVSQVDLLGHSIYDVSHPCDHNEIRDLLSGKVVSEGKISVFLRIKCTLSSKGRNLNIKSASYKVLHVTGNFVSANEDIGKDHFRFVTIAHPIPHPVDIEAPLGRYTFLSKHSLDMKFTYADERMTDFLGYNPDSLIGKSLYNYHHAQDNKDIEKAFKSLFAKGQSETGHYRFLAQGGGYAWVSTQATVIYCEKGNKPLSVVCVNYVISEKLNEVEIYSYDQLEWNRKCQENTKKDITTVSSCETFKPERPQPATKKIFAPRTKDMNTRFLMYTDDDSGFTVMKDEPEDLTHLAPTAGDVCVPLGTNPLLNEVMNQILPDNYNPLINEDKETPLFSSYRDDSSTRSLSPSLSQSPGSLPSLCGIDEAHFEDTSMKSLLNIDLDSENDDISTRAPYISMTEADDLPILMSSDLIWNVNFPIGSGSNNSSTRCSPSPLEIKPQEDFSSLAHLLQVDKEDTLNKYPDQGGGPHMGFVVSPNGGLIDVERRKRVSSLGQDCAKKRKQTIPGPDQGGGNSVLMNLLVAGRDVGAGYVCVSPRRIALNGPKRET
uniref:Hypoxia inducible factor 1 Sima n=1 Tax=Riptortus pedestris TaxID=329032 RepID=A0A896IEM0_RIPPE|nr:hypoxia inducible factor 1 Sima [Riptortus pedestris]